MKGLMIASLFAVLSASQLHALTLRATSGEHSDFSRVIIFVDEPIEWKIGRVNGGYAFEYSREALSFDSTEVFEYIPKTRLSDLDYLSDQKRIIFRVNCICHLDAFELRNGHVAIDFKDGPASPNSKFETYLNPPQFMELGSSPSVAQSSANFVDKPSISGIPINLDHFRDSLIRSFSNSTLSGAITARDMNANIDTVVVPTDEWLEQEVANNSENIIAESQLSIRAGSPTEVQKDWTAENCIQDERLEFRPGETLDFRSVQELRGEIISASLLESSERILDLATYYLGLGMASEARAIARESHEDAARYIILLSEVLLGEMENESDFPQSQLVCDTQLSVWAVVGGALIQNMSPKLKLSIVEQFSKLPQYLQIELGGRLANAFLDVGEDDLANRIARIRDSYRFDNATRTGVLETEHISTLSDSELDLLRRSNDDAGGLATLEVANRLIRLGQRAPDSMMLEVASFMVQYSGQSLEQKFTEAYVALSSFRGEHYKAFGQLEKLAKDNDGNVKGIHDLIVVNLTEEATDFQFALVAVAFDELVVSNLLDQQLQPIVFERLLSVGLPNLASELNAELGESDFILDEDLKSIEVLEGYRSASTLYAMPAANQRESGTDFSLSDLVKNLEAFPTNSNMKPFFDISVEGDLTSVYKTALEAARSLSAVTGSDGILPLVPNLKEIAIVVEEAIKRREGTLALLRAISAVE